MNITSENIIALLLEDSSRAEIYKAIASEKEIRTIDIVSDAIQHSSFSEVEIEKLKKNLLQEGDIGEEIFLCFISHEDFPKRLLYKLLSENKYLNSLIHRREPIDFLLKLIETNNDCIEAIITVGRHYYLSQYISSNEFADYVKKYQHHDWLLSSLTHILDRENPKTEPFLEILKATESGHELREKYFERMIKRELSTTTDIQLIEEKFATNNHKYLQAIAKNPYTPVKILKKLTNLRGMKYSKYIRLDAQENLKLRKNKA